MCKQLRVCDSPHLSLASLVPQVFVTAQARTLDLASVYAQGSGALVVVSPGMKQALLERLDKYIFPGDKASARCMLRRAACAGPVLRCDAAWTRQACSNFFATALCWEVLLFMPAHPSFGHWRPLDTPKLRPPCHPTPSAPAPAAGASDGHQRQDLHV